MTTPHVEVAGARELRRQLRAMQRGIDGLRDLHKDLGELVGDRAAQLVPVQSGRLRGTIRAAGQATGAVVRAGYAVVPYAGPVHFGWPSRPNSARDWRGGPIPPNPFLYDALDDRRGEVFDQYERRVGRMIDDLGLA